MIRNVIKRNHKLRIPTMNTTLKDNKTESIQKNLKNIRKALKLHMKDILGTITDSERQTVRKLVTALKENGITFSSPHFLDEVEIHSEDGSLVFAYFSHSRTTGQVSRFHLEF